MHTSEYIPERSPWGMREPSGYKDIWVLKVLAKITQTRTKNNDWALKNDRFTCMEAEFGEVKVNPVTFACLMDRC